MIQTQRHCERSELISQHSLYIQLVKHALRVVDWHCERSEAVTVVA